MRLFGRRRTTESAPRRPKPERLPPAALVWREQEREEAEREEELRRVSREEIEQACKQLGHWWPGEVGFENRLSGRPSWRSRLAARLFGGGA